MGKIARVLTGLAAVAFVLAVVAHLTGPIAMVSGEGYSRACADLALLAIALRLTFPDAVDVTKRPNLIVGDDPT